MEKEIINLFTEGIEASLFAGLFYAYFYRMSKVIVECCANSVQSAINGQTGGAARIELCANLEKGGTTPSAASICLARELLDIDLYVLIRPRVGNFVYSDFELEEMLQDIEFCKEIGCEGVVIGALDKEGRVHKKQMQKMMEAAGSMGVTFHRAFDVATNPKQALEDIIELGCERLLTSGQAPKATDGIKTLKQLVEQAKNRINIMVGSGVNASNCLWFYPIGIRQFHLSGAETITQDTDDFGFGANILQTNTEKIQEVVDALEGLE